jgi:DNA (cytosine-5)-methyltransferase 1
MFRVVQALRPSWVLVENVSHFDGLGLEQVVSDLEGDGYEVAPPLEIPACAFGFDHWRPRLWILGYADRYRESGVSVDAEVAVLPSLRGGEPKELGKTDGVPGRVDRLGMLGNAVIPAEAEWIGRNIVRCAD